MKELNKDEVFGSFRNFLKSKGIELQEGTYAKRIRQACDIVTDSANLSQRALEETKSAVDRGLEQLRQTIHEQTAPKPAGGQAPPQPAPAQASTGAGGRKKGKPAPKRAKAGSRGRKG